MKKYLIILVLFAGMLSCENSDVDFPDYKYTSGYFPYQYPIRTLVLGDYVYDNTNDNEHKFLISAAMGGVYENESDRIVEIEVAPELCDNVSFNSTGNPIKLLPQEYYTLSSSSQIVIPSGKVNGGIEVQLKDAFFDDPLAITLAYVLPVRIKTAHNLDTVLRGKTTNPGADPRVAGDWETVPKDFTMFAVKFVNQYHGNYLHRGKSVVKTGDMVETDSVYRHRYAERNELWSMVTTGKNQVKTEGFIKARKQHFSGAIKMFLNFVGDGTCTITDAGSVFPVTGTGKFVEDADEWGNKKRNAIFLNYQFTDGVKTYQATDTLAIRDRDVVMEVFTPNVN